MVNNLEVFLDRWKFIKKIPNLLGKSYEKKVTKSITYKRNILHI